jgi:hypothetical protein
MLFAVPMTWTKPKDNLTDCYLWLTDILCITVKPKRTVQYPDLLSAIRSILHSEVLPLPSLPGTPSVGDEICTKCNGAAQHYLLM